MLASVGCILACKGGDEGGLNSYDSKKQDVLPFLLLGSGYCAFTRLQKTFQELSFHILKIRVLFALLRISIVSRTGLGFNCVRINSISEQYIIKIQLVYDQNYKGIMPLFLHQNLNHVIIVRSCEQFLKGQISENDCLLLLLFIIS